MIPVISWHLMSQVLFSSLQFKFGQCYTCVMKKKKKKKKLNIVSPEITTGWLNCPNPIQLLISYEKQLTTRTGD